MEQEKAQKQLPPSELWTFEHVSTRYSARIPQGVDPDDLLMPAFWAHQAMKLRPMDEIRAHAEDGTWVAYFLVLDCSRTWAKLHRLALHRLTTADVSQSQASEEEVKAMIAEHTVAFRGQHKWSVIRKSDRAVLLEGKEEKPEAIKWLEAHVRSLLGVPAPAEKAAAAALPPVPTT